MTSETAACPHTGTEKKMKAIRGAILSHYKKAAYIHDTSELSVQSPGASQIQDKDCTPQIWLLIQISLLCLPFVASLKHRIAARFSISEKD
jgi:hypothetical protein